MTLYMRYQEEREEGREEGRAEGRIEQAIISYLDIGMEEEKIIDYIKNKFSLTQDQAKSYYKQYSGLTV